MPGILDMVLLGSCNHEMWDEALDAACKVWNGYMNGICIFLDLNQKVTEEKGGLERTRGKGLESVELWQQPQDGDDGKR
jgi:hypothetical protein